MQSDLRKGIALDNPERLLPILKCPACGAKGILYTRTPYIKSHSVITVFTESSNNFDFVMPCPKCKTKLAFINEAPYLQQTNQVITA